ncbi:MAG: hypothetical protein EXX96DRAFT_577391 [Benjaminiella poitrasii]|nr:MAG: hypothetical protein EXX96DRAFT_577391 [Benjaminiella poitrasii]
MGVLIQVCVVFILHLMELVVIVIECVELAKLNITIFAVITKTVKLLILSIIFRHLKQ